MLFRSLAHVRVRAHVYGGDEYLSTAHNSKLNVLKPSPLSFKKQLPTVTNGGAQKGATTKEKHMALAPLTPEQRTEALAKAAIARKARADVKTSLKAGALTIAEVIRSAETSDIIGKMKVSALLESLPGMGKIRAKQVMERLKIAEGRRVKGLGANQRKALEEEFAAGGV